MVSQIIDITNMAYCKLTFCVFIEFKNPEVSHKKKSKSKKSAQAKKIYNARQYIDDEVEEASEGEDDITGRDADKYTKEELEKKNLMPDLDEMQRRYAAQPEDPDDDSDMSESDIGAIEPAVVE